MTGRPRSAPDVLVPASIRVFTAVAEHGGVTAAARALGLSQPAVSAAIHKLEEELETTLLLRTSRGVSLTATGHALLKHAQGMERAATVAHREIGGLEDEPRGRFTIGCHESLGAYFLPPLFTHFFAEHPAIDLVLSNANSRDVERAVIDRRIDFGVVVNPEQHPESIVTPLFVDRVAIVAHRALFRNKRPWREMIAEHALVHAPALRQTQFILGALDQAGVAPRRAVPCVSLELVKSLVLDRVGLGILPLRVARYHTPEDRVRVVVKDPGFDDRIALVRRVDLHVTSAAHLVLDAFAAHGKELTRHPNS